MIFNEGYKKKGNFFNLMMNLYDEMLTNMNLYDEMLMKCFVYFVILSTVDIHSALSKVDKKREKRCFVRKLYVHGVLSKIRLKTPSEKSLLF